MSHPEPSQAGPPAAPEFRAAGRALLLALGCLLGGCPAGPASEAAAPDGPALREPTSGASASTEPDAEGRTEAPPPDGHTSGPTSDGRTADEHRPPGRTEAPPSYGHTRGPTSDGRTADEHRPPGRGTDRAEGSTSRPSPEPDPCGAERARECAARGGPRRECRLRPVGLQGCRGGARCREAERVPREPDCFCECRLVERPDCTDPSRACPRPPEPVPEP